jgi:hypothetical protein
MEILYVTKDNCKLRGYTLKVGAKVPAFFIQKI